jgi:hypothetical protein
MTDDGIDDVRGIMASAQDVDLPDELRRKDAAPGIEAAPPASNVTPLRANRASLKPRALALLGAITWSGDVAPHLQRAYIVKGWLDRSSVSVVYGPSNVGKSFLALDLAHHIAKGRGWGGRRVAKGRVLYIAAEGGGSFSNRVAALDDPEFFVLTLPVTLTGKDSQAGPLSEVIQHLAAIGGSSFDLIVIDTMARVMGGLDENTAPDIADLVRNLDLLRRATGAHVMLVHHSGKDAGRGARGHSSLRAAIDTEIELTRDDLGLITAEVTKQRDGPTGYKFAYTLRQVELGQDQDGDPVTTCLVEPADPAQAGRVVSGSSQIALDLLDQALAAGGEVVRKPQYPGGPCVGLDAWRSLCVADDRLSSSDSRETRLRAFRRLREDLVQAKQVLIRDDLVWRVE